MLCVEILPNRGCNRKNNKKKTCYWTESHELKSFVTVSGYFSDPCMCAPPRALCAKDVVLSHGVCPFWWANPVHDSCNDVGVSHDTPDGRCPQGFTPPHGAVHRKGGGSETKQRHPPAMHSPPGVAGPLHPVPLFQVAPGLTPTGCPVPPLRWVKSGLNQKILHVGKNPSIPLVCFHFLQAHSAAGVCLGPHWWCWWPIKQLVKGKLKRTLSTSEPFYGGTSMVESW